MKFARKLLWKIQSYWLFPIHIHYVKPLTLPLIPLLHLTTWSPLKSGMKTFIVCPTQLGIGAVAAAMFQRHKLFPNIVLEISRNETAVKIASAGVGMVFCPVKTPLRMQLIQPMAYFSLTILFTYVNDAIVT